MRNSRLLIQIMIGILVASCSAHHPRTVRFESQMLRAEAHVTKIKHFENQDWFVYGTLRVDPKQQNFAWLNLNCFRLKVGNRISKAIYIDLPAWVPTDHQKPNANHSFEVDVYWVVADLQSPSEQETSPLELVYQPAGQCFGTGT
jgi:hypothetical protein